MAKQIYTIYSHEDTDGGIAAGIFARFIQQKYPKWDVDIQSVNHGSAQTTDWSYQEINFPCAILDFSLHAQFLNERFFTRRDFWSRKLGEAANIPECYWIDHHPTGTTFNFINEENLQQMAPRVVAKWDTTAISTPGLFRTHRAELGFPDSLIEEYEEYIDLAEIVDGALYASAEGAHDFSNTAVKLQCLFSSNHPALNKQNLYRRLARYISHNPNPESLLDADPLYPAIVQYERELCARQLQAYTRNTRKLGNVAFSNFINGSGFEGMSRFLPYILFPDVEYAIHLLPRSHGHAVISCGINPWNKPQNAQKHLGKFFAKHFNGGGHSFVAGGRVADDDLKQVDKLIDYIQKPSH